MDHTSLQTASTYINNLLLARGLLRNGEPIPFDQARPSKSKDGDTTMAKIMNLVHDLILRRDVRMLVYLFHNVLLGSFPCGNKS